MSASGISAVTGVGDVWTNGCFEYEVIEVTFDGGVKLLVVGLGNRHSYTSYEWRDMIARGVLKPMPKRVPAWKPEVGGLARVVRIGDCCVAEAARVGLKVGDVREVTLPDQVSGLGVCVFLEKPGPVFVPEAGDEVEVTAVGTNTYWPNARHKLGDRFVIGEGSSGARQPSSDEPGYCWLGPDHGRVVVRLVESAADRAAEETFKALAAEALAAIEPRIVTNSRLYRATYKIGPNALKLLADIAERLAKGATEHGDFDKPRTAAEWSKEAYEEDLDAVVYRTLRLQTAKAAA